ncbi:MAG: hypothetical protein NTV46_21180 [Verrucomicrobia bacterium]|nr:hypothetical protein [Verrucomicrobiota bacterium]
MIFLSILAKTLALALGHLYPWLEASCGVPRFLTDWFCCGGHLHPWLAGACWVGGAVLDVRITRKAIDDASFTKVLRNVIVLNLAALVIGWAALNACDYAAMRWTDGIPVLASLVGGLLSLTGLSVGAHGGMIYLTTMAGPLEYAMSIDHLALKVPCLFFVLSGVWLLWAETTLQSVLRKSGIIAGILLAVTVVGAGCKVLLFLGLFDFVGYESEELPFRPFMGEAFGAWLYLPFLLGAGALIGRMLAPPAVPDTPSSGMSRALRWGAVPLMLALAGIVCWQPLGTPKPKTGKCVISSYHAQWSRCDRPYDREWYGADSGYNYASLKRFFGVFYPVVEAGGGPLLAKDLDGASTLVIYDPDRRFSEEEIKLVREFVRSGGGLFLIGDHTNVFGGTSHMNELCSPFGFQFRDDVLFDLDEDFHQMMYPPQEPSRFWHGVSLFKLRGPTSLRPTSFWTRSIYQVYHAKGVRAIYSVNNFYPPPHDDPKMKTGTFCVSAASRYGRGRVVAWADSTIFSTFEIFYPGKYEYLLNTMEWLNHKDDSLGGIVRRITPILALAGLALFLARRREPRVWLATAVLAVACLGTARITSLWVEQQQAAFPAPVRTAQPGQPVPPVEWVFFGAHAKDPGHNLCGFVSNEPYDQRYEVFIQWVMRTGPYPGFYLLDKWSDNGFYQHLQKSDATTTALALIVRKPDDLAQLDELGGISTRAKDPLLLMFSKTISVADAVDGIKRAGLVKDAGALARVAEAWPANEVVISDGERRVLVVAGAERFSDQAMGISEKVVPDAAQRALFNQAFGVIDRLFGRAPLGEK